MKLTFAIADLHGRFDLLQAAYGKITEYASAGRIVHLGDYVDRGPQSREIIEFLIDEATIPEGFTRVVLKGNHEDMMVETLTAPLNPQWWIGNGGGQTLVSYGHAAQGKYTPKSCRANTFRGSATCPKSSSTNTACMCMRASTRRAIWTTRRKRFSYGGSIPITPIWDTAIATSFTDTINSKTGQSSLPTAPI